MPIAASASATAAKTPSSAIVNRRSATDVAITSSIDRTFVTESCGSSAQTWLFTAPASSAGAASLRATIDCHRFHD